MLTIRPTWTRGLSLIDNAPDHSTAASGCRVADESLHACSWFQSRVTPGRYARYSLHMGEVAAPAEPDHTLAVVREFRRVPLVASALALALFSARPGRAAALVATLAHFAERAVSLYQPAYLLLARSLEEPRLALLLTGVDQGSALATATRSPFSLSALMPEALPLLAAPPELYTHCTHARTPGEPALVSSRAV